jgi:PAS domain S-box-containing protein
LEHERWLSAHKDASGDGLFILSAQGKVLSWNPAFAQLWKLSAETMAGHSWATIAGHMESLATEGWADFHTAASKHDAAQSDSCWDMTLEGGKRLEVYSQVLRDHPGNVLAVRFHFRDVTRNREMETQLRSHEEQNRQTQKKLKQLEKDLSERDRQSKEMEATLLDHQDRLHKLHVTGENQETTRRLVIDVANEINNVLAIILGNTDVLRDALPPDHVAQKHLDDIHQAARKVIELSQRLHAISAARADAPELRVSA